MKVKISGYPEYHYWLDRLFGWNPKQRISVRVDKHDTWSMDHTLAPIIYPMLVQLKETQHGHPNGLTEQEWDALLDEMIWAFGQKARLDDWMDDYDYIWDSEGAKAHQLRMTNGFMLFGKYYENLWD